MTAPDAALLWAEKRSTVGRNLNWTTTDVVEAFRAGQSHDAGLLAALEKMMFVYEHGSTLSPEYRVAAWTEAVKAIAAAKGA